MDVNLTLTYYAVAHISTCPPARCARSVKKIGQVRWTRPMVWKDEEIKHKHKRGIAIYNLPNVLTLYHTFLYLALNFHNVLSERKILFYRV